MEDVCAHNQNLLPEEFLTSVSDHPQISKEAQHIRANQKSLIDPNCYKRVPDI